MPKVTKKFVDVGDCALIHYQVPDDYLDEMGRLVTDWQYGDLISEGNSVVVLYNQYVNFEMSCIDYQIPVEENFDD